MKKEKHSESDIEMVEYKDDDYDDANYEDAIGDFRHKFRKITSKYGKNYDVNIYALQNYGTFASGLKDAEKDHPAAGIKKFMTENFQFLITFRNTDIDWHLYPLPAITYIYIKNLDTPFLINLKSIDSLILSGKIIDIILSSKFKSSIHEYLLDCKKNLSSFDIFYPAETSSFKKFLLKEYIKYLKSTRRPINNESKCNDQNIEFKTYLIHNIFKNETSNFTFIKKPTENKSINDNNMYNYFYTSTDNKIIVFDTLGETDYLRFALKIHDTIKR